MADETLKPAAELAAASTVRFPNESDEYRAARTALLAEEVELRRQLERVAARRRALPPGGVVTGGYRFIDENGAELDLADMFGGRRELLLYFMMYGPQRQRPCPMCSEYVGGLAASAANLRQRIAIGVVARSPIDRLVALKRERGWRDLPVYQAVGDAFPTDYGGLAPEGEEWPALNLFEREGERVRHFWGAELGGTADPGQDPRGAPDTMLWATLDLTRAGRGSDWYPSLVYRP